MSNIPIISLVREAQKGGQIDQNKTLVDSQTRAKFRTLSAKTKHGASACRPAAIDSLLLSLDIKYSSLHEKKTDSSERETKR